MDEHPSPEFERELRETLSAPGADPAFVRDLRVTLLERATMKTQTRTFPRLAWGLAFAVLFVGLLVVSPQVVEALKRLVGYVPGIGYVEPGSSLRMLAEPATLEKEGVILTIEQGAADPQRTVLLGHLTGYPASALIPEQSCDRGARLVLPDGRTLGLTQWGLSSMNGLEGTLVGSYYVRYVFEAMPAGVLEARLEIPCLLYDDRFKDWSLALQFEVADANQVMPVIDLPTAQAPGDPVTAGTVPAGSTIEGFSIVFESESPLPDGYILSGSYQWTDPRFDAYSIHAIVSRIADANGESISMEAVEPLAGIDPALKKMPFAYQIHGKDHAWPLTYTVDSVTMNLPDEALFQFDAGADPQVGQTWDVSIDVPVAGHIIHVQSIELTAGRTPTELGFSFTMRADLPVMGATIHDAEPVSGNGGGGGGGGGGSNLSDVGPFTYGWTLEGYSPAGVKTFVVSNLAVRLLGVWEGRWQPANP